MRKWLALATAAMAACAPLGGLEFPPPAPIVHPMSAPPASFVSFYQNLKAEAQAQGLDPDLLDEAYQPESPHPLHHVLAKQSNQPEFTKTFEDYLGSMVAPTRILRGRELANTHASILQTQTHRAGIPAGVMLALWGLESNYGTNMGNIRIVPALTTLAWESPRPAFFKKELFAALRMAEDAHIPPASMSGSWAGAMGGCQFMPSSYQRFGTDGNGDGIINIWTSPPDIFASTATFLQKSGWKKDEPWKIDLPNVPSGVILNTRGLSEPHPISFWLSKGIPASTLQMFNPSSKLRLFHPTPSQTYLLGSNFEAILKWNKSSYYAFAVLTLAEALQQPDQP